MSRGFHIFYKVVAVLRFIGIPLLFLFDYLDRSYVEQKTIAGEIFTFFFGTFDIDLNIDFHISFWEYLFMYSLLIAFPLNTIINLLVAFKPRWSMPALFKWKPLFVFLYVIELLVLPVFIYLCIDRLQDVFPPKSDTYFGQALDFLSPGNGMNKYEEYLVFDLCVLALCSLVFVLFFWKVYRAIKKSYSAVDNN
jgi:hypothetical protein